MIDVQKKGGMKLVSSVRNMLDSSLKITKRKNI